METEDYSYSKMPVSGLRTNYSLYRGEIEWIESIGRLDKWDQREIEICKGHLTAIENELAKRGILEAENGE